MHPRACLLVKRICKAANGKPPFTAQVKEGQKTKTCDVENTTRLSFERQGGAS